MRKVRSKRRRLWGRPAWRPWRSKLALLSAACLLGVAMLVVLRSSSPRAPSPSRSKADMHAALNPFEHLQVVASGPAASPRLYSVIPGGIHSEKQLASVLATEPVVARHYAGFDVHELRFIRLQRGRDAYVSFRVGNQIFWTSKKIPLFAGETLVTDGTNYARARCGNRISEIPRQPTLSWEPSALDLSLPIIDPHPVLPTLPPLTGVSVEPLPIATGSGSSGGSPFFFVPPFPPPGGSGWSSNGPPPPDAPLPTPEPSTFVLLSSGLAVLGLEYLLRFKGR